MDLGALFLLLLVLVLILLFVSRPFFVHQRHQAAGRSQELSSLLVERERLLNSIQELDSDHDLEKIPAGEYAGLRADLMKMGADLLREIDVLAPTPGNNRASRGAVPPASSSPAPKTLSDDELEELLARRRTLRRERAGGFCPKCGQPVLISDAFCPDCGYALK